MSPLSALRRSKLLPTLVFCTLVAPMLPRIAHADSAPAPAPFGSGSYDAALGLPETGAAVANGTSTVSVSASTGTLTASINFEVPAARGRSQPHLGLRYSSAAGNGVGGWGWGSTVPAIQRTPLSGAPTFGDPYWGQAIDPTKEDRFSLDGAQLVPICTIPSSVCSASGLTVSGGQKESFPSFVGTGWTYFRLEAAGADGRVFWSPTHDTWVVQYKTGETLEFGNPLTVEAGFGAAIDTGGEHVGPQNTVMPNYFRWNLVRQYDSERNVQTGIPTNPILYQWAQLSGDTRLYLTDVYDTESPDLLFAHHVHYAYENLHQAPPVPYNPPIWRGSPRYDVAHVDVTAAWQGTVPSGTSSAARRQVRRYWMYHAPDTGFLASDRILLKSAYVEGRCATPGGDFEQADGTLPASTNCPSLLPTTYDYATYDTSVAVAPLAGSVGVPTGSLGAYSLLDVNSDGVPDISFVGFTPNNLAPVSNVWLVGTSKADTLSAPSTLSFSVPSGQNVTQIQPSFQWASFSSPFETNPPFKGTPIPNGVLTGNFLSDGHINQLVSVGINATTGAYNFAIATPSQTSSTAWSLTATSDATINFWSPQVNATCCGVGTTPQYGYYVYGESVYAIADVDGDGFPDALTDTPVAPISNEPSTGTVLPGAPILHYFSLRSTAQSSTGAVTPFTAVAPGNISNVIPAFQWPPLVTLPVSAIPTLPAAAQYVSSVSPVVNLEPYEADATPLAAVLGNPHVNTDAAEGVSKYVVNAPFFADMNGDGVNDWSSVIESTQQVGSLAGETSALYYWVGHGDGTFGACADGSNSTCPPAVRANGAGAYVAMQNVPDVPRGAQFVVDDVTGDGFSDLLVGTQATLTLYINQHGVGFDSGTLLLNAQSTPSWWGATAQQGGTMLLVGDMNGSGVDDVAIASGGSVYYIDVARGVRPGLLASVTTGYGASSSITYETTPTLAREAAAAGTPWTSLSPQIAHHVVTVTESNGMTGQPQAQTRTTQYSYANAVYDPRDREFVGFQTVTRSVLDSVAPTVTTQTHYLSGVCSVDQAVASACAAATADRPYLALRGLPFATDVFDAQGHHQSTTVYEYQVNTPLAGLDGRSVHFAYPATTVEYLYDPSVVSVPMSFPTTTVATFDGGLTSSNKSITVYSLGATSLERQVTRDELGNTTKLIDYGRPNVDAPLSETMTWTLPGGDPTAWQWRVLGLSRAPVSISGAPSDQPLNVSYQYYADGAVESATTYVTGTAALYRTGLGAAPPATTVAENTQVQWQWKYDIYGNETFAIGPGGTQCEQFQYDSVFKELPVSHSVFRDGCSTATVVTSQAWDLGLERVTTSVAADSSTSTYGYDAFGRVASYTPPNATTGGPGTGPQFTVCYDGECARAGTATVPGHQTITSIADGTSTRLVYSYADAWGQPLATVSQADPSAGDDQPWIIGGVVMRSSRGSPIKTGQAFFWNGDPTTFPATAASQAVMATSTFDAFGHVVRQTGYDGQATMAASYHVLEEDVQDASELASVGPHTSASSKVVFDGHGRVSASSKTVLPAGGSTVDVITTSAMYNAAGQPLVVTRSHTADSTVVTRTLQYDSLGHLTANIEPNTAMTVSTHPRPPMLPVTLTTAWTYVYDASGRLVGTSDARGCGENMVYDGLGRLRWEDYSGCTSQQAKYTSAPSTWSDTAPTSLSGAETYYAYDTVDSSLLDGRLVATYDRAAITRFAYDGRGRTTQVSRQLATPSWVSSGAIGATTNYSGSTFAKTFSYDGLNRLTGESTGATQAALLGQDVLGDGAPDGTSRLTATYSARGILAGVQGSYGTILASNVSAADGLPLTAVYGDASATTVSHCYDVDRRLAFLGVSRGTALNACAHPALGSTSTSTKPAQTVLVADSYTLDAVGNPLTIADLRTTTEWGPGSMPVNRSFVYDDSYHVTQAQYAYATKSGTDSFTPPAVPAETYQTPMSLASASARVTKQNIAYDWMGNTTSSTDDEGVFFDRSIGTITNGTASAGPNQLVSASYGTASQGSLSAAYDAAGDLSELDVTQPRSCSTGACASRFVYAWDELGRLAQASRWDGGATSDAVSVSYVYDAGGARVLRASTQANGTIKYNAEVFPSLRLNHANWNGVTYESDVSTEVAFLTLGGASFGRVLATGVASSTQHVFLEFTDALGSTSAVVDKASGELVSRSTYFAYGGLESRYVASDWSAFWEEYGFTGKESDVEVGLVYFGARYYSPQLGRWISPDPLAIHALGADLNPYAYVGGRVTAKVDPLGLDPPDDVTDVQLEDQFGYSGYSQSTGVLEFWGGSNDQGSQPQQSSSAQDNPYSATSDAVGSVCQGNCHTEVNPDPWTAQNTRAMVDAPIVALLSIPEAILGPVNTANAVAQGGRAYPSTTARDWGTWTVAVAVAGAGGKLLSPLIDTLAAESMEGAAQGAGFKSFEDFKSAAGPAGDGMQWHHLVEQNPANVARFAPEALHNTGNLVRIPEGLHGQINAFYSSPNLAVTGSEAMTVRQWVSGLGFAQQQEFGQAVYDAVMAP